MLVQLTTATNKKEEKQWSLNRYGRRCSRFFCYGFSKHIFNPRCCSWYSAQLDNKTSKAKWVTESAKQRKRSRHVKPAATLTDKGKKNSCRNKLRAGSLLQQSFKIWFLKTLTAITNGIQPIVDQSKEKAWRMHGEFLSQKPNLNQPTETKRKATKDHRPACCKKRVSTHD